MNTSWQQLNKQTKQHQIVIYISPHQIIFSAYTDRNMRQIFISPYMKNIMQKASINTPPSPSWKKYRNIYNDICIPPNYCNKPLQKSTINPLTNIPFSSAINAAPVPLNNTTVATFAGRSVCPNAKCNGVRFRLSTEVLEVGYCSASITSTSSEASLAHAFYCWDGGKRERLGC